jgi:hypothetical protein
MNKNIKLATFSVAVVAGLLGTHLMGYLPKQIAEPTADIAQVTPDTPLLAQTTPPQASSEQIAPQEAAMNPEDVDFDEIAERLGTGYDPMLFFASAEFSDAEIEAYNRLHVLPFNPVVDEVCHDFISDDGESMGIECRRIREREEHQYASLPMEELQELGYSDALAALFMGERSKDLGESMAWYLRSAALSGKPGPLIKLAKMNLPIKKRIKGTRGFEPEPRGFFLKSAVLRVAREMGDPRAKPEISDARLLELGESEERIVQAEHTASKMLSAIRRIQAEVGVPADA